jgi:hypothetical protein
MTRLPGTMTPLPIGMMTQPLVGVMTRTRRVRRSRWT